MGRVKLAWLYPMCRAQFALLPAMCGANLQTVLQTQNRAMKILLRTWNRGIVSGTQQSLRIAIYANFQKLFIQTTYFGRVYTTYVTTFKNTNILRESIFKDQTDNFETPCRTLNPPCHLLTVKAVVSVRGNCKCVHLKFIAPVTDQECRYSLYCSAVHCNAVHCSDQQYSAM